MLSRGNFMINVCSAKSEKGRVYKSLLKTAYSLQKSILPCRDTLILLVGEGTETPTLSLFIVIGFYDETTLAIELRPSRNEAANWREK